jgi:hypothetical protein
VRRWAGELDFLKRPARTARGSWLLLLVAVGGLLVAVEADSRLQDDLQREIDHRDRLDAALRRLKAGPAPGAADARAAGEAAAALRAHVAALRYPWKTLIQAVERASTALSKEQGNGVALLSLSHQPDPNGRGVLAIEGLSASPTDALRFADELAANSLFSDVHVRFHEPLAPGASPPWKHRFAIDATVSIAPTAAPQARRERGVAHDAP